MARKSRKSRIKNLESEQRLFLGRVLCAGLVIAVCLLLLATRLWYLQYWKHDLYATASRENQVKLQVIPPTRGLIFDRNGVELAVNLPTYGIYLIPEQIKDIEDTLDKLGKLLDLSAEQLEQFRDYRRDYKAFESIPLVSRLSDEDTAKFAVQSHNFPGVVLQAVLNRSYPQGLLTAHSVGYVGRITKEDLAKLDQDRNRYQGTHHIGKSGVEQSYESLLHGEPGYQQVEVDAHGRVIRVLTKSPPVSGQNLRLSIDLRLQQLATQALGERNGAVVALDPSNGEVLVFVSQPGFDPNLFVHGISKAAYQELLASPDRPLFNRALQGKYPPGSAIKPFIGIAGLAAGATDYRSPVYCPGFYRLPGHERKYRCWKRHGHGALNLHQAIAQSCDVFFYQLAARLGIDRMQQMLNRFGFGHPTNLDIAGESAGLVPSQKWKRNTRGAAWYPGETIITGIGQGFLLATPLQLAVATGLLAMQGELHRPHLGPTRTFPAGADALVEHPVDVSPGYWRQIIAGMVAVFADPRGTAHRIGQESPWPMAGKSGTSQVFGLTQKDDDTGKDATGRLQDHALFIAFAPVENPRIAVAVVVENGGSGSRNSAPIARLVIDRYLASLEKETTRGTP